MIVIPAFCAKGLDLPVLTQLFPTTRRHCDSTTQAAVLPRRDDAYTANAISSRASAQEISIIKFRYLDGPTSNALFFSGKPNHKSRRIVRESLNRKNAFKTRQIQIQN